MHAQEQKTITFYISRGVSVHLFWNLPHEFLKMNTAYSHTKNLSILCPSPSHTMRAHKFQIKVQQTVNNNRPARRGASAGLVFSSDKVPNIFGESRIYAFEARAIIYSVHI